jgi:twitching motility protein PilT
MNGIARASRLRDLEFSDLYLGHPRLESWFSGVSGLAISALPLDHALHDELALLAAACEDAAARGGAPHAAFRVLHDEVSYRGMPLLTAAGRIFLLRRLPGQPETLSSAGIPPAYVRRITARFLSGLFIVCGGPRSGRTTTAGALLKERLLLHGGLAVTVEDPVELSLAGPHGEGLCLQTSFPSTGEEHFPAALRGLLRNGAGMVLVDEVSTPAVAAAVLQAAIGGPLVVATLQSEDILQCLVKLHALASERLGADNARVLLSEGLAGILHLQIARPPRHKAKLESEFLFLDDAPAPRALLRRGEYEQLASVMRQQMATMISESALERFGNG